MAYTALFDRLRRSIRTALFCEREGISTAEGLERREEAEWRALRSRRDLLALGGLGAIAAACGGAIDSERSRRSTFTLNGASVDVGIVGAGLAGLVCANQLLAN